MLLLYTAISLDRLVLGVFRSYSFGDSRALVVVVMSREPFSTYGKAPLPPLARQDLKPSFPSTGCVAPQHGVYMPPPPPATVSSLVLRCPARPLSTLCVWLCLFACSAPIYSISRHMHFPPSLTLLPLSPVVPVVLTRFQSKRLFFFRPPPRWGSCRRLPFVALPGCVGAGQIPPNNYAGLAWCR